MPRIRRPRRRGRVALPAEIEGECVFCRIVADGAGGGGAGGDSADEPRSLVARTDRAVAFLDVQPATPGHTLVVPGVHAASLTDLDPADGVAVWELGVRVAAALRACGLADGTNFFLADGLAAGQEVWHVHLHVIGRMPRDGMLLSARWSRPSRPELDTTAERMADAIVT